MHIFHFLNSQSCKTRLLLLFNRHVYGIVKKWAITGERKILLELMPCLQKMPKITYFVEKMRWKDKTRTSKNGNNKKKTCRENNKAKWIMFSGLFIILILDNRVPKSMALPAYPGLSQTKISILLQIIEFRYKKHWIEFRMSLDLWFDLQFANIDQEILFSKNNFLLEKCHMLPMRKRCKK